MSPHSLRITLAALGASLLLPLAEVSAQPSASAAPPPSAADVKSAAAPTTTQQAPQAAVTGTSERADTSGVAAQADQPAPNAPTAASTTAPAPAHPTWTGADIARVRAMLRGARERGQPVAVAIKNEEPSPTQPEPPVHGNAGAAFALGFSVDAVWNTNQGYSFFSRHDATPRLGLWLGHDLLSLHRKLFVAAELGWGMENLGPSDAYGLTLRSKLITHTFFGAATLRWALVPWLQPHARIAAGASLLSMEVTESVGLGQNKDSDHAASPFGSLGAGVLLRTPTRLFENDRGEFAWLSFGILIEGGYAVRGPVSFALGQSHGSREIPVASAKLGELSLSGPYLRTSLVARF